jgi:hypothetical protein
MNLPSYLERLIWKGQAEFKTRTFFGGLNWAFEVPDNKTIIILEVNYVPLLFYFAEVENIANIIEFSDLYRWQQLSLITDKNSSYFVDSNLSTNNIFRSGVDTSLVNVGSAQQNLLVRQNSLISSMFFNNSNRKFELYQVASDYVLIQQAFSNSNLLTTTSGIEFLDPITQQKFVDAYNLQIGFSNSGDVPFSAYNGDFGYTGSQNSMFIPSGDLLSMNTVEGQTIYNSGIAFNGVDSEWWNVNRVMLSYVEVSGNLETLLL